MPEDAVQLQQQIQDLTAKLTAANEAIAAEKAKRTEAETQLATSRKNVGEQGTEIGELRKKITELETAVSTLKGSATPPKQEAVQTQAGNNGQGTSGAGASGGGQEDGLRDKTLEQIRSSMTKEELADAQKLYDALPDEGTEKEPMSKALVDSGESAQKEFLLQIVEKRKSSPKRLFEKPHENEDGTTAESIIRKAFRKETELKTRVPSGGGGAPRIARGKPEPSQPAKPLVASGGSVMHAFKERAKELTPA